jgi:phosphoenolpyruvate synthase/pyruvate phosphate dikinase
MELGSSAMTGHSVAGVTQMFLMRSMMLMAENDPVRTASTIKLAIMATVFDAVAKGRATREDMKMGICGEHGGDPTSIAFCHKIGLSYVSCSPFRVPIARLAAAQAALAR